MIKNNYQNNQKVKFQCQKCKKEVIRNINRIFRLIKVKKFFFLCRDCQQKKTNLEKYGVESTSALDFVKKKSLETKLKNNSINSKKRIERLRKVFKEKNDQIQLKRKQTCIERYGMSYLNFLKKCPFCEEEMDFHVLPRHIKCCSKNPKNIIDEKDGIIQLTKENIEKVKKLPKNLQRYKSISYTCRKCGEKIILKSFLEFKSFDTCFKCDKKYTCIERYGGVAPACNENIKRKVQQSHLNHSKEQIEKSNKKRKLTCIEKYGVEAVSQNKEVLEKQKETNIKKSKKEKQKIEEKRKNTMLRKYGVEHALQSKKLLKKARKEYTKTCIEKYGLNCAPITKNIFNYDNQSFDSKPELCFYIYCKDHNLNIKRTPTEFKYNFEGKIHYYFPDFEIEGKYYEIKGNQFLKEDGTWSNPFDSSLDNLFEAKRQCAIKNNVIILYEKDYMKYEIYIKEKYGKDYLNQFKR